MRSFLVLQVFCLHNCPLNIQGPLSDCQLSLQVREVIYIISMCMTSSLQLFYSTLLPIEGTQGAFCCSDTTLEQKDLYGHLWLLTPTLALPGQSCLTLILSGPAHPAGASLRSSSIAFLSSHCKPETYTSVSGDTEASCLCLGFFSMTKCIHFYNPKGRIKLFCLAFCCSILFTGNVHAQSTE